jgi:hypothetical protein
MTTSVHKGDTVRLKASFYTFAGVLADPTTVSYTVYDDAETVIVTGTASKESTGVYYYDYTTTVRGVFSYEFNGTLETKTILSRDYFAVIW